MSALRPRIEPARLDPVCRTYWNNHHHLVRAVVSISGASMWADLHLLFWLSLLPFTTRCLGENHFARLRTTLYGTNLLICAVAYFVFQLSLIRHLPTLSE